MENQNDIEVLEQIGLSKNEVKVYFALLDLEQSSATPIVRKSGIPNSKIYPTLEKLIKRGLVSFVIKNNVKYFQASDPRNLIGFLNRKKDQIAQQQRKIEELIPRIEQRKKQAEHKQEATIYEELAGVKAAFNEIINMLDKGDEYLVFTLGQELEKRSLKLFFQNYHKKRMSKGITVRLIANADIKKIFLKYHIYRDLKVRFTKLDMPTGIFIYGNNVMTVVWGDRPTAFVIKSKSNADRYREFFENMWKMAK